MEEPFSLKTLSYWSLLKSTRSFYPSRFPPLVRDTILGDIDFLKKLQGRYLMVHTTGHDMMDLTAFSITYGSGINFQWTNLGNFLHGGYEASDNFRLGSYSFTSQIFSGLIEENTSYNVEKFHVEPSCLVVISNDFYFYNWTTGSTDDVVRKKKFMTVETKPDGCLLMDVQTEETWSNTKINYTELHRTSGQAMFSKCV